MNNPITLCDRCDKNFSCLLEFDGKNCRRERTAEPTKADCIRSMSDEQLADFIWGVETEGRAYGPRGRKAWIDWLKQEATHE